MKTSIPILRSYRPKIGGGKIEVFPNKNARMTGIAFERATRIISEEFKEDFAGYAIVAWAANGANSVFIKNQDTRCIGVQEVPDFVKSCLLKSITQEGL